MYLTAHFADKNWKLDKKILNFHHITSQSRDVMAKTVEMCLSERGINCFESDT